MDKSHFILSHAQLNPLQISEQSRFQIGQNSEFCPIYVGPQKNVTKPKMAI